MLNVLLLDDDEQFLQALRQRTEDALRQRGFSAAFLGAATVKEAETMLDGVSQLDLALLDIDMGAACFRADGGLRVAEAVRERFPACAIIFVTAYLNYATEVYEVQPIYFILKDQLTERLENALNIFQRNYSRQQKYITVTTGKTEHLIQVESILFCERGNRRTKIVTSNEEIVIWDNLQKMYQRLPEEQFAVCHKSYIVGLRWVANYDRFFVTLTTGQTVPISRSHREQFRTKMAGFLMSEMQ